jgi:hypothetical protein
MVLQKVMHNRNFVLILRAGSVSWRTKLEQIPISLCSRHPEARACSLLAAGEPRRMTAALRCGADPGRRPPISGLREIGIKLRKSARADLRWLARPKKPGERLRVTARVILLSIVASQYCHVA